MSETAEKLKVELGRLSSEDREELAQFLISSLDGIDDSFDPAFDAELLQRAEEIRTGKAVGIPAEQVFRELREKHS